VFVSPTTEELFRSIEAGELDVIQIHGSLPADVPSGIRIWRAVPVAQKLQLAFDAQAEAYLLDTPTALHGGSGQTFEWSLASTESSARLILAGGLEAANVGAAIRIAHPWGVDACSRLESAPGVKDPQKVKAFVEAARAAFLEFSPIAQSAFVKETV
jgi:phosphoribosylanthranilate isomerase